jgi:hypothetical protein
MSVKKRVLPNYVDKKLQICQMSKLHIFVITNICNQIFVTFGRIGTRSTKASLFAYDVKNVSITKRPSLGQVLPVWE